MRPAKTAVHVDPPTRAAVSAFLKKASAALPVQHAILYGSRARGDARPDSDADVAVILPQESGPDSIVNAQMQLSDLAYDVLLDTGIRVSPLPIWQSEWDHPKDSPNPRLLANIRREGIRL
ncbi:MAG TPA: nucleotidyltransferase domain-containing protein [Ramlibacter sp.]|uniref:nucleotidyltransferase family protein n=1 Tax=Ramlibacter sp. TaxID=1917967 RepID=UPI002B6AB0DD|nr:nucleotidyltransferase domain-containing protein [Ramlibacter sp.]HVZ46351.1 nucleotidyltransferase domain-containing protein [Ramlibacter sp.]